YGQGDHDQDLLFPPLMVMRAVLVSRSNGYLEMPVNMGHFRQAALATSIRRDLTWVFCSPVMENVEVLTIPLSDIERYLACVSNFKSLIHVSFLMDEFLNPGIGRVVDQCLEEVKQAMTAKRNQQFRTMFEFVRQHLAHFPKQLQQAECPMDSTWLDPYAGGARCPQEILNKLKSLLPAANRVWMINHTNLIQVANHIQETNIESVEAIELQGFETQQDFETGDAVIKLMMANLNRCRRLKRFNVQNPVPEAFKWAVEERQAWDRYHAAIAARAAAITTGFITKSVLTSVTPIPPPLPLVPLATIGVHTRTKRELDDIVFAFGGTLKELSATVGPPEFHLEAEAAEDANVAAGQPFTPVFLDFRITAEPCWSQLPALTKIHLQALRRVRFVIEPGFFTSLGSSRTKGCDDQGFEANLKDENDINSDNDGSSINDNHNLESLTIVDGSGGPYRCQDLHNCEPFPEPRPKMTYIELSGYPALVFHPDSLLQTPNLRELRLASSRHGAPFIPPVAELEASFWGVSGVALQVSTESLSSSSTEPPALGHRAAWTWDWQLPNLTLLHLSGEFALLFKFQMLVGCPSLEKLQINISTREDLHKRVLSVQDFMADSTVRNGDDEHGHDLEVVTASSLKDLTLIGPWFMDDETIQVMYGCSMNRTAVFPKLTHLSEYNIQTSYSVKVWLTLLQGLPDLKKAHCGLLDVNEVGAEILMNDYGLIARPRWVTGLDGRTTLEEKALLQDTVYYFYGEAWSFPKE
ncbi:hypothetical protein BGZ83_001965, partial [Gryganskiella cystojenkinii]